MSHRLDRLAGRGSPVRMSAMGPQSGAKVQRDLLGRALPVLQWRRIGTDGRRRPGPHPDPGAAFNGVLLDKVIVARLARAVQSAVDGATAGYMGQIGIMLLVCVSLCGCFGLGNTRLYEDQLGYSRALGDAEKSDTLLNVVRLRYADAPIILQATQVISGYQLQRNVTGGFEVFPTEHPNTFVSGSASAQLQQSPTFTFQPLSGAQFAESFVRPLSPAEVLPLANGGLPIDVLFRLCVQSINGLSNAVALTQVGAAGSPDFFLLLRDLRRLQIAGVLSIRLQRNAAPTGTHRDTDPGHVYFYLATTRDPDLLAAVAQAKRLLGMPPGANEAEVVYGYSRAPGQVALLSRSMLGVLAQLSLQIEVPPDDIARHRTHPTVGNIGLEHRPVVIIHSGGAAPADVFTSAQYRGTWFWIAEDDFDSKLAFSVVQILLALSRTEIAPGAIVTIPAG